MKAFEYVNPANVSGAVKELTKAGSHGKAMAGGIDLLGELKDYIRTPDVVVNLKTIPGLNRWVADNSGLKLGPLMTLSEVQENGTIQRQYAALAEAGNSVGTPQIRNVGTLGRSR